MESMGNDEDATTLTAADRNLFVARVSSGTSARVGEMLRLAIDLSRLYFFSPETGERLLGGRVAAASPA
jgi:hypothetical protein